jgi:hypothetical protein
VAGSAEQRCLSPCRVDGAFVLISISTLCQSPCSGDQPNRQTPALEYPPRTPEATVLKPLVHARLVSTPRSLFPTGGWLVQKQHSESLRGFRSATD